MNNLANLIQNEWEKIPQSLKYLFLVGGLLIFNAWLLDHWGEGKEKYEHFWFINIPTLSYFLGLLLILLGSILLPAKQIVSFAGLLILRKRYPPSHLNKTFYLISFAHKWMLFDKNRKECFHLKPWETVLDLHLEGLAIREPNSFQQGLNTKITIRKGLVINIDKYEPKGIINTRQ